MTIALDDYGEFVSVYHGTGAVSIIDGAGEKSHQCSFETGQMNDGDIILICHNLPQGLSLFFRFGLLAKKFEGKTEDGYFIVSNEPEKSLLQLGYLSKPENLLFDQNFALQLTELSITFSAEQFQEIHFGICNFQFNEQDIGEQGNQTDVITIPLNETENIELCIKKLDNYDQKIKRIIILKTIDVTCEVILKISNRSDLNKIISLVDDICILLSVKNGTKITWIYYDIWDGQGQPIFRKHASRVTKIYQPLDIFYFKESPSFPTKKFLEDTYLQYVKYRDVLKLNRGVIDVYLDAKAPSDYIETRGGKIALAIEFLKNEYLGINGENSEYICLPEKFTRYVPFISTAIADVLKAEGVDDRITIQTISDKKRIEGLNRRSFRSILNKLIKEFGVDISSDEVTLFITCRDSLVHRGNFYCITCKPEERQICEPLPSYLYEYFFMINILDRIYLRILDLDDKMIRVDWRNPSDEIKEWLM